MKPKATQTAQEARAAARVKHACLAWVEGPGVSVEGLARTIDVSASGAGLILSKPLPTGERVVVDLLLMGQLKLRATGVVMHSTKINDSQVRVGVRFDHSPVLVDSEEQKTRAQGASWLT